MMRVFGDMTENKAKLNTTFYDAKSADRATGSPIGVKAAPGSDGGQAGTSSILGCNSVS